MSRLPRSLHKPVFRSLATLVAAVLSLSLAACGGGGGGFGEGETIIAPVQNARSLSQFGYIAGSGQYVYGHASTPRLAITGAPGDVDMNRFAMAHDGSRYWLFVFQHGSDTTLYPFYFDGGSYRFSGVSQEIRGAPSDADTRSFAVLHDGVGYALYLRSLNNELDIYQFRTSSIQSPFVHRAGGAISPLHTTGGPADADYTRWTMFHDGSTYRQAVFQKGSADTLYQFGWNGGSYAYGRSSRGVVQIVDAPENSFKTNAKILHDGSYFRLYQLAP